MSNMTEIQKYVDENELYKKQIKDIKSKRKIAKMLEKLFLYSFLIYVLPMVTVLILFSNYSKLTGATIAIAYFVIVGLLAKKYGEDNRIKRFVNEYSESKCNSSIFDLENNIENNESIIKSMQEGENLIY